METSLDAIPFYTLDEIIRLLSDEGYKLTKRTFQFYVQSGLLPKGIRKGQGTGGVKFFYPQSVIETIKWIFALKSKGFNLVEIKETFQMYQEDVSAEKERLVSGADQIDNPFREKSERLRIARDRETTEGRSFLEAVMAETPEGSTLTRCLQCGTCGGSCPSAEDMDYTPRHLFAMLLAGLKQEVLLSNTPWFCVSCYYCTVRCPQQIPITDIMYTLKQMAVREGIVKITDAYDFSKTFINLIEKYGRSFDFGLAMRYRLDHNPADRHSWGSLALKLYKKERIVLGPSKIEGIEQLRRIVNKAKERGRKP
ncbi:MAG: 4Fe-4S dicluster domain-containing protein [Nitrospirota bacterium]